jgi:co-chaperonin GroES (HSP10)
MKLRPLPGWVLVEILPAAKVSAGGIEIPEHTFSPEERQTAAHHPTPPEPLTGRVVSVGPWPKTKKGLAVLPEFHKGNLVLVGAYSGVEMSKNVGDKFRMVRWDQVIAVLE